MVVARPSPCPGWGWPSANGSVGLWSPLRDRHLPLLPLGGQRGALHEEDLLQEAATLLHSSGDWHPLLQRPLPAHPRGMASPGPSLRSTRPPGHSGHRGRALHFHGKQKTVLSFRKVRLRLRRSWERRGKHSTGLQAERTHPSSIIGKLCDLRQVT